MVKGGHISIQNQIVFILFETFYCSNFSTSQKFAERKREHSLSFSSFILLFSSLLFSSLSLSFPKFFLHSSFDTPDVFAFNDLTEKEIKWWMYLLSTAVNSGGVHNLRYKVPISIVLKIAMRSNM